jgi:fido (protein-threonine AMPylation protein)
MGIFFRNREGQTPIDESMKFELIPSHISDMTELFELEKMNIAIGIEWSKTNNLNHLDYLTWTKLHKRMFDSVWKFSGKTRKTELNNPDFLMPFDIMPALKDLQNNLTYWLEANTYSERELMSKVHERLLTIHPFKDGNGRWSRLLVNMICEKENIEVPSWGIEIVDDETRREVYIDAVKKARSEESYDFLISFMYSN